MNQEAKYNILEISDEQVLETEQLGSKSKFWISIGAEDEENKEQEWLFKIPRENTGEHWAEKVAAEVAELLDIPCADIELAKFRSTRGSCSKSFINQEKHPELIHGNEILAGRVLGYDKEKKYGQSDHTYANIRNAIAKMGSDTESQRALKHFAGYIVLDGLIGNTDRHHENWAFLKWTDKQKQTHQVIAPTFDHASSLGRELLDEKRELYLKENRVEWYINRGQGAIFAEPDDKNGLNPFGLLEFAYEQHPDIFQPWLVKTQDVDSEQFEQILNRVPDSFISGLERKFALRMLEINLNRLKQLSE